jgi:hypothetical protein
LLISIGFWSFDRLLLVVAQKEIVVSASEFEIVRGRGELTDRGLDISVAGAGGSALVFGTIQAVPAKGYSVIEWDITGLASARDVTLLWAARGNSSAGITRKLTPSEIVQAHVRLDAEPRWQGEIVGLGLMLRGPLKEPVAVRELRLEPKVPSFSDSLSNLAAPWTFFEPWSGKSINFYRARPASSTISPVATIALWIGLSLLCYGLLFRRPSRVAMTSALAVFVLIGWFALDARWQWELGERLIAAQDRYGELATTERTKAAPDARLIGALEPLRARLSADPARIMILSKDPTSATPARLRYHLAPHRAYAGLSGLPSRRLTRAGDYILVMDSLKSVRYDRSRGVLVEGKKEIPADLVERAPRIGNLFRVRVGT